jgi:hypothetical protein
MEGIGQLMARRAAPPDGGPDGGIPSPGRLSRRLKPVAARHAQLLNPAELQNAAQLQNTAQFENFAQFRNRAAAASSAAVSPAAPSPAGGLDLAVAAMDALRSTALADSRWFAFPDAADFAGRIEEIARTVEFLQIVAAQAVERTRHEAQTARQPSPTAGWRTGWTEPTATTETAATGTADPGVAVAAAGVDDGYRNAAEFLRARLRISISEARRRLTLAAGALPQTGITGEDIPARHPLLAEALSAATIGSRSATVISLALDQVRHLADSETAHRMEHSLTRTAVQSDPDFVNRMAKRWVDAIDQDGTEPSEEELRHRQGAFIRKPRRGLHHLEIFATAEQFETLATVMNTATNPRLRPDSGDTGTGTDTGDTGTGTDPGGTGTDTGDTGSGDALPSLDRRSRAQKLLDGLVGACAVALTTGELPANGGLRPQVMVTIDYQDLPERLDRAEHHTPTSATPQPSTGASTFHGPLHPTAIRKIACDADIIPVLLGSDSRVLDIGRTTRIFPPHIRKALIARDQGCAFPDCTIPAPWCEAHHITYWTNGGKPAPTTASCFAHTTTTSSTKNTGPSPPTPAPHGSNPHPTSTPTKHHDATTTSDPPAHKTARNETQGVDRRRANAAPGAGESPLKRGCRRRRLPSPARGQPPFFGRP